MIFLCVWNEPSEIQETGDNQWVYYRDLSPLILTTTSKKLTDVLNFSCVDSGGKCLKVVKSFQDVVYIPQPKPCFYTFCLKKFSFHLIHKNMCVKTPEHEYIFSKYSRNLSIAEIFCVYANATWKIISL